MEVKNMADLEARTNAALTTGIIGTAGTGLALLNGGLGNILGGLMGNNCNNGGLNGMAEAAALAGMFGALGAGRHNDCGYGAYNTAPICENQIVNRYELGLVREIDTLKAGIAQRDANTYTDQKLLEVYKYFDGELKDIRAVQSAQAVTNAKIEGTFAVLGERITAQGNQFMCALNRERDERCCGDNSIVTYVNATFYPKLVADVTAGTTTTAQPTYNPVYNCGCGCK
jgi:hypothetical protein